MDFNEQSILSILENYEIGNFKRIIGQLESGFQSTNYHIQTSKGEFVLRIIHDKKEDIEFGMLVHDYLSNHGIKTPKPIYSKNGTFTHLYENQFYIFQTYVPGTSIYEPLEAIDPLLPFFGQELGRIHSVLIKMNEDFGEKQLKCKGESFSWLQEMGGKFMPDNEYVKSQYSLWQEQIRNVEETSLSMGIIHGDVGPKDFFFKNNEFTGIMDFNATQYGYFLSDVVSMMMYSDLIYPNRTEQFTIFIKNYLKTAPVDKKELRHLKILLSARWFIQIFYHQYRFVEQITQGMEEQDYEENLNGVKDGIDFLKTTNKYPENYFYNLL